jgi:hypothetical protein
MGTLLVSGAGMSVMREHLVDLFAEIACYSSKEANLLLDIYPDYRHAVSNLDHGFWMTSAAKMLNEATRVEFSLRLREKRNELGTLHAARY